MALQCRRKSDKKIIYAKISLKFITHYRISLRLPPFTCNDNIVSSRYSYSIGRKFSRITNTIYIVLELKFSICLGFLHGVVFDSDAECSMRLRYCIYFGITSCTCNSVWLLLLFKASNSHLFAISICFSWKTKFNIEVFERHCF